MVIRTSLCLAALLATGCATRGSEKAAPDAAVALQSAPPPLSPPLQETPTAFDDPAELTDSAELDTSEPDIEPEDFDQDIAAEREGFCTDDIYTRYLVSQYKLTRADKLTSSPIHPKNKRRKGRNARHMINTRKVGDATVDSLFYAKNRLLGPTVPYFGAMPIVANEMVELWIQYYKTAGRREFMRWLVRGESVKRVVQPLLQESGIPNEFFYLAMVESGFSNIAYSRARATGTWQFMQGTAKLYGLKINHWVDERRDPVKSSIAAANYLKDLYDDLGDWHLAMAAYNAGPGRVRKAVRMGGTSDFWELARRGLLPRETAQYVPKVLAAVLLAADHKAHGFEFHANPSDTLPDTEVIVRRPARLDEIAASLGVSTKTLLHWNPELIRNVIPPNKSGYALRLSSQYANMFPKIEQQLSLIEIKDVQMHVVRKGDTLARIARQYKCDVRQILSLNPDLKAKALRIGKELAVPAPGVVVSTKIRESA